MLGDVGPILSPGRYPSLRSAFSWPLEISLTGQNLVHTHHVEAANGFGLDARIPRSVLFGLQASF